MGRLLPAGAALAHTVLQGRAKRADFFPGGVFSKGWKKAGWDLIFLVRPWKKAGWPKPPFSNTKCLTVRARQKMPPNEIAVQDGCLSHGEAPLMTSATSLRRTGVTNPSGVGLPDQCS